MSGVGGVKEMLARQASEQAEAVTRLTESELQRRSASFEQLLTDALNTTERILSADAAARRAERTKQDKELALQVARQISRLEKRLLLGQVETRRDTFRPILIGALTSGLTMVVLLLALLATLEIL